MADSTPKSYSTDPTLYIYTSLSSGSSYIVTATSRLETILKANKIPFKAIDLATDEKARMLWGRRSGKDESGRVRKLPGLVQMGLVVGDLVEIDDWNEYGELKQHVNIVHEAGNTVKSAAPTPSGTPSKPPAAKSEENVKPESSSDPPKPPVGGTPTAFTLAMRQVGDEAAAKAKTIKSKTEVLDGTGEADSTTEDSKPTPATPSPVAAIKIQHVKEHAMDAHSALQSPTSTAWKKMPKALTSDQSRAMMESLQSPTSTAWKPTDVDPPITMHRGSSVSTASAEEIREVERSQAIHEEDEDAVED